MKTLSEMTWSDICHDCFWVGRGFWLWAAILSAVYIVCAGFDGSTFWGGLWCFVSGMCLCRYLHIAYQPQANKQRCSEPTAIN